MVASPVRSSLYRIARWVVILAGVYSILAQILSAQLTHHETAAKGPRAVGLLELAANGKAHLIPIVIMWDGKFYDAGAYKASPVPIALQSETVYEAVRTGVSQGLFTVTGALHGKDNEWVGAGKWQSAAEIAAAEAKKKVASKPKPQEQDLSGPPVLRRRDSEKPKPEEPTPSQSAPPKSPSETPSTAAPPVPSAPGPEPTPAAAPAPSPAPSSTTATSSSPPADPVDDDPNRPTLRRGKPAPRAPEEEPTAPAATPNKATAHPSPTPAASVPGPIQLIPAISDASGPEPRPYAFSMKPDEEQKFRTKMLAFAADEVRARATQSAAGTSGPTTPARSSLHQGKSSASKLPQPSFDDVQLRVFDLSNSNEPVLVLTTKARLPQRTNAAGSSLEYYVTLVVRSDIYGELHKAFANVTDNQHLDVLPRFELIDAVDVDGDGRGELLFRQSSDAGTAFVIYRVIGDQLWPLFQGTPGA
jgi:hypothetical protein